MHLAELGIVIICVAFSGVLGYLVRVRGETSGGLASV